MPLTRDETGVQSKILGGAEQFTVGQFLSRLGKLMSKLRAIDRKVIVLRDNQKASQSGIGLIRLER